MSNLYQKLKNLNKKRTIGVLTVFVLLLIIFPAVAHADFFDFAQGALMKAVNGILLAIANILSWILVKFISLLLTIVTYDNFIHARPVEIGWVLIRDVANMFFIVLLMVISVSTILGLEYYSYKKMLPKLLVMAVLINFSRTICGLFIDFSQVVTLTFANAFAQAGQGNFVTALGLDKILALSRTSEAAPDAFPTLVFGVLFLLAAIIVVASLWVVFLARIVSFWILIVLSPLAYLAGSSGNAGQKYASQWWDEFTKNLVSGPFLAFFLWLSFSIMSADNVSTLTTGMAGNVPAGNGIVGEPENTATFFISLAMLWGSLVAAQQIGAAGASTAMGMAKGGAKYARGFTGYDRVKDVASTYMSMRKSKRDAAIRAEAGLVGGVIGGVKSRVFGEGKTRIPMTNMEISGLAGIGSGLYKNTIGQFTGVKNAERIQKSIGEDEEALVGLRQGAVLDEPGKELAKKRAEQIRAEIYAGEDSESIKKEKLVEASRIEEFGEVEGRKIYKKEQDIKQKEDQVKKAKERQKKLDKIGRYAMGAGGAGVGLALGGVGLVGLAGAIAGGMAGYKGIPKIGEKFKDAGKNDLNLASNYYSDQISDYKKDLKDLNSNTIKDNMDNYSKSDMERVASMMEAIERELLGLDDAKKRKEEIGAITNNDKKTMAQVEALLEKRFPAATDIFKDAKSTDVVKRDKAKREIEERASDGTYVMRNMDTGSLVDMIDEFSNGVKTSDFISQFKSMAKAKQDAVKQSMRLSKNYKTREKLAHIENMDFAFNDMPENKSTFLRNLKLSDIREIIDGSSDQIKAFKAAVGNDINVFSKEVQDKLSRQTSPSAKSITKELDLDISQEKTKNKKEKKEDEEEDEEKDWRTGRYM